MGNVYNLGKTAMSEEEFNNELAQKFHEHYEKLAPNFSYKTRPENAVPWKDVPENNKQLMIAVVQALQKDYYIHKKYFPYG